MNLREFLTAESSSTTSMTWSVSSADGPAIARERHRLARRGMSGQRTRDLGHRKSKKVVRPPLTRINVSKPLPAEAVVHARIWRWLMYRIAYGLAFLLAASQVLAADVESGRRLAQQRCAACHIANGSPRNDLVADAPPFLAIGRKYGFDTEALVFNLVGPHRKMNFASSRPEANDIAAYIQSLPR